MKYLSLALATILTTTPALAFGQQFPCKITFVNLGQDRVSYEESTYPEGVTILGMSIADFEWPAKDIESVEYIYDQTGHLSAEFYNTRKEDKMSMSLLKHDDLNLRYSSPTPSSLSKFVSALKVDVLKVKDAFVNAKTLVKLALIAAAVKVIMMAL